MKDWKNDPRIEHMDKKKLNILETLTSNIHGQSPKELFPLVMAAIQAAKKQGLSFTEEETSLLIEILKEQQTPEEAKKTEKMLKLFRSNKK